ncbi:MAG: hypothetical protein P0107_01530 [Nitrosomonas sp.]|nr:hypothetical protein [Nitrosomonas sp.]
MATLERGVRPIGLVDVDDFVEKTLPVDFLLWQPDRYGCHIDAVPRRDTAPYR